MAVPLNLTQLFSNNAVSLLAAPITTTSTSLTVMTGYGDLFPQPTGDGSDYFLITLEDQAATIREIIKVTDRVGDTLFFSLADRGQENTTLANWSASSGNDTLVDHRITAETMARAMLKPQFTPAAGSFLLNQPFIILPPVNNTTVIELNSQFQTGSTALYIGGLRQKLGIDYLETSSDQLMLSFALTQTMIDEGQHVTVDFISA